MTSHAFRNSRFRISLGHSGAAPSCGLRADVRRCRRQRLANQRERANELAPHHIGSRRVGAICRLRRLRRVPSARACRLASLAACGRHAGGQRQDGARPFRRQHLQPRRRDLDLLQEGRQVLGSNRRAGRKARRFRNSLHVRRLSVAAISDRTCRKAGCRRSALRGTRARRTRAGSAGSISIPIATWQPAIRCTGPASIRIGIISAHSVIPPISKKTTTQPPIASKRHGRRSASGARPATGPPRAIWPGRRRRATGSASTARGKGSRQALMSEKASPGPWVRAGPPLGPSLARRARRSKPAPPATPGASSSPMPLRQDGSSMPSAPHSSSRGSSTSTGNSATRFTPTPRSSRAACTPPA